MLNDIRIENLTTASFLNDLAPAARSKLSEQELFLRIIVGQSF